MGNKPEKIRKTPRLQKRLSDLDMTGMQSKEPVNIKQCLLFEQIHVSAIKTPNILEDWYEAQGIEGAAIPIQPPQCLQQHNPSTPILNLSLSTPDYPF